MNTATVPATAEPIAATGVRGFLLWLKREQPGIYAKAAPQIAHLVPGAFKQAARIAGLSRRVSVGRFGTYATARDIVTASLHRAEMAGLGQDVSLQPINVTASTEIPTDNIAASADTGSTSSGIADTITSIVNGITSLYTTKEQANTLNQLTAAQIAQAQAGRPPLSISTGAYGIPTITAGTTSLTTILVIGGGLALVAFLLSRRRS